MNARIRCRGCRQPIVIVAARLFEWPRYAAGLIDDATAAHSKGCPAGALSDIGRIWNGGRL